MKLKQMTLWFSKTGAISIGVYYAAVLLLHILSLILFQATPGTISFNGVETSLFIVMLVIGIVSFGQNLRFGLANGVSRRSVYLSFCFFLVPAALISALFSEGLLALVSSFSAHAVTNLFYELYRPYTEQAGAFFGHFAVVVCSGCISLFFGLLGYLIGGAFYRLGKIGRYVLVIGLPVGLFGVLPIFLSLLPEDAYPWIAGWLIQAGRFLMGSPFRLALAFLLPSVLLAGLCWLLIRRAPLKTAS